MRAQNICLQISKNSSKRRISGLGDFFEKNPALASFCPVETSFSRGTKIVNFHKKDITRVAIILQEQQSWSGHFGFWF
jgi:hypothetical protein